MRKTRRLPVAAITTDVISAGLAIWVLATVAGQHPNHNFDRIRIFDRASVFLPNWRFFAPIPASKDVVLVHRVRRSGNVSDWEYTHTAPSRTLLHVFWFPQRRVDKGVFDVVGRFLRTVERIGTGYESSAEYRLLRNFVKRRVQELNPDANDLDSFQFAIIREAGFSPLGIPRQIEPLGQLDLRHEEEDRHGGQPAAGLRAGGHRASLAVQPSLGHQQAWAAAAKDEP